MEFDERKRFIDNFLIKVSIASETKIKYLNLKTIYDKKYKTLKGIETEWFYRTKRLELLGRDPYFDREAKKLFNKSNELNIELRKLKREINFSCEEYISSNKSLSKFLNNFSYNLNKTDLKIIANFFDVNIDLDIKSVKEGMDFIVNFVSEDLENMYLCAPNFSHKAQKYEGSITLMEIVLTLKKKCELDIANYKTIEKRLIELDLTEQIYKNSHTKLSKELEKLELLLYNRIFRKKLIESLDKEKYDKYVEITKCEDEKYKLSEKYKTSKKIKNDSYEDYKKVSLLIPQLINKLGENSLRRLIKYLNITIPKTEDNYFNEKEEMKLALMKWFSLENKKIDSEFNTEDRIVVEYAGDEKVLSKY